MIGSFFQNLIRRFRFSNSIRKRALIKLAVYTEAKVSTPVALHNMAIFATKNGKDPNNYSASIFRLWENQQKNGRLLSSAMKGYIPDSELQIITAGEKNGRLAEGIRKAIEIHEGQAEIVSAIRSAAIYPVILISTMITFLIYLHTAVFPSLLEALPVDKWPSSTSSLASLSEFLSNYLYIVIAIFIALGLIIAYSLPRWTGKIRQIFDNFPIFSIYKTMYGTIFMLSVAGYVKAGMNTPEIMSQMLRTANPWYANKLRLIKYQLSKGASDLGDALVRADVDFPDANTIEDLRVISSQRGFDEGLETIGRTILKESINRIRAQAQIFYYAGIFSVGGVMFWYLFAQFDFSSAVSIAAQSPDN